MTSVAQCTPRYSRDSPIASTNRPTPTRMPDPGDRGCGSNGSSTTRTTPRIAADASACPDGNDSFVSVTSRKSTGGRSPADGGLADRHQQPGPGGDHRHQHGIPAPVLDQQEDDRGAGDDRHRHRAADLGDEDGHAGQRGGAVIDHPLPDRRVDGGQAVALGRAVGQSEHDGRQDGEQCAAGEQQFGGARRRTAPANRGDRAEHEQDERGHGIGQPDVAVLEECVAGRMMRASSVGGPSSPVKIRERSVSRTAGSAGQQNAQSKNSSRKVFLRFLVLRSFRSSP